MSTSWQDELCEGQGALARRSMAVDEVRCVKIDDSRQPHLYTFFVRAKCIHPAKEDGSPKDQGECGRHDKLKGKKLEKQVITRSQVEVLELSRHLFESFDTLLDSSRGAPPPLTKECLSFDKSNSFRKAVQRGTAEMRRYMRAGKPIIYATPDSPRCGEFRDTIADPYDIRMSVLDVFFSRVLLAGGEIVASSRALQDFFALCNRRNALQPLDVAKANAVTNFKIDLSVNSPDSSISVPILQCQSQTHLLTPLMRKKSSSTYPRLRKAHSTSPHNYQKSSSDEEFGQIPQHAYHIKEGRMEDITCDSVPYLATAPPSYTSESQSALSEKHNQSFITAASSTLCVGTHSLHRSSSTPVILPCDQAQKTYPARSDKSPNPSHQKSYVHKFDNVSAQATPAPLSIADSDSDGFRTFDSEEANVGFPPDIAVKKDARQPGHLCTLPTPSAKTASVQGVSRNLQLMPPLSIPDIPASVDIDDSFMRWSHSHDTADGNDCPLFEQAIMYLDLRARHHRMREQERHEHGDLSTTILFVPEKTESATASTMASIATPLDLGSQDSCIDPFGAGMPTSAPLSKPNHQTHSIELRILEGKSLCPFNGVNIRNKSP